MQIGQIRGNHHPFRIEPGAAADSAARVGRVVVVRGIMLDAQIGSPRLGAETDVLREPLAGSIGARQTGKIPRGALRAADEEAHRRSALGRRGSAAVAAAADSEEGERRREKSKFHSA